MITTKPDTSPVLCNITNPTRARRVIYTALDADSRDTIVIDAGETKYSVTIAQFVAEELNARNAAHPNSDLVIQPPTNEPTPQATLRAKYERLIAELEDEAGAVP